jgi:hypothetical protein
MNGANTIVMGLVVATGATAINRLSQRQAVEPRVFIGSFIVGTVLLAAHELWPQAAVMLAVLIALSSLLINGGVIFTALNRTVNR